MLCPVRPLRKYLKRTSSFVGRSHHLFLSPRSPSRALSKNGIYYLLLEMIFESGACKEDGAVLRVHSIHGIATSSSIISSFYFKDLWFVYEALRSLGPVVASGERIG